MSDPARPPYHPLVEFVHDLREGLSQVVSGDGHPSMPMVQGYGRCRWAVRSVRRFADALDLFVDELEARSISVSDGRSNENGEGDDDFQTITISNS
jgi:hypothetical protein